jgi:hypothetical protein
VRFTSLRSGPSVRLVGSISCFVILHPSLCPSPPSLSLFLLLYPFLCVSRCSCQFLFQTCIFTQKQTNKNYTKKTKKKKLYIKITHEINIQCNIQCVPCSRSYRTKTSSTKPSSARHHLSSLSSLVTLASCSSPIDVCPSPSSRLRQQVQIGAICITIIRSQGKARHFCRRHCRLVRGRDRYSCAKRQRMHRHLLPELIMQAWREGGML